MAIDEWLEADAAHRETFRQLQQAWELGAPAYQPPNAQAEWERFAAQRQRPVRRMPFKWWMAAAAAVLCMALVYVLWAPQGNNQAQLLSQQAILRDTLPDQSVVVLPPRSELRFDKRFNTRTVQLKGEGYFDIRPDENRPFVLEVEELRIRVLGTAFNVRAMPDAILVQVNSGAVQVSDGNSDSVIRAEQQFRYDRAQKTATVADVTAPDKNGFAYATRQLHFQSTPLRDVVREVAKAYNVSIALSNEETGNCRLSTDFDGQSLTYVLEVITASLGLQYTINGNNINISGNECR